MRKSVASAPPSRARLASSLLAAAAFSWAMPGTARAQIYVGRSGSDKIDEFTFSDAVAGAFAEITSLSGPGGLALSGDGSDLFVADYGNNRIGEYNAATGATINSALISVSGPSDVAVSGNDLYIANSTSISEYDISGTPTLVTAFGTLGTISGFRGLGSIALSGPTLFASDAGAGKISAYSATTGAQIVAPFVATANAGIAVSGSNLFVANNSNNTIDEYSTGGSLLRSGLISGLNDPDFIAISGNGIYLFVTNILGSNDNVGEYTISGVTVNASLITGLPNPNGLAVSAIPEPAAWSLFAGLAALLFVLCYRRRKHAVA